jgi:lipoprotein-releasing system permease protein
MRVQTTESFDLVQVTALVDLGAKELNRRTVIVPLRSAQNLLGLPGGVTSVDLTVRDVWAAQAIGEQLRRQLPYQFKTWQESNAPLVSALNAQSVSTSLIRAVVLMVLLLGIASVLVVFVVQKQREIGILRAMGAMCGQVLRVFLVQRAVVGALGSALGVALAWAMVALFDISLPPALALQLVAVVTVCGVLAAIAPARRAAAMDPAQAIRL